MAQDEPAAASFEQTYDALRRAVEELESGSLPLDVALARYEQAMTLVRACNEILDTAELRIQRVGLEPPARGAVRVDRPDP